MQNLYGCKTYCVLVSVKQNDLLRFIMELDVWYYMIMKDIIQLMIELDILLVKKVVLKIVKNSIEKILTFHNAIILIKSIVSDNKYDYYYNIFFKKFLYKVKSNIQNFQINVFRL